MFAADGAGSGFTVTVVEAVPEHPFKSVAVTLYVPLIAAVELAIVGFCAVLEYVFGPLHEYVFPPDTFN